MELIQNGFSCEYEMNVFMKMFFKKDDEGTITTFFEYDGNLIRTRAEVEYMGKLYRKSYEYPYKKRNQRQDKIVFRCFVVRAFTDACEEIKKVSIPWGALSGIRPAKVVRQMYESGMSKSETKKALSEIFGVKDEKTDLALEVADNEKKILAEADKSAASIYIGIPFCPSKCLYCSFVSSDMRVGKKYVDEYIRLVGLYIGSFFK